MSETVRKQEIDGQPTAIGPRTFRWTVSTASVDRDNDTIAVNGWDVAAYRRNPVIQFAHDYGVPPVGRAKSVEVRGERLEALIEFAPAGIHPLADTVCGLVAAGFLRATSVGFRPKRSVRNSERGGTDFQEQELLEISIVPVPANAEALIQTRGKADASAVRSWLSRGDRVDSDLVLDLGEATFTHEEVAAAWPGAMRASVRAAVRDSVGDPLGDRYARHRHDVIDVEPNEVRAAVRQVIAEAVDREALGRVVQEATRSIIDRMRGRVD